MKQEEIYDFAQWVVSLWPKHAIVIMPSLPANARRDIAGVGTLPNGDQHAF